ncbi:MAG: hypothetical protein WA071_14855 [Undibacterium umbellatum]|uniref:hypothetical protein n=1 Tax=Undibacterium umbellatum TaxID=2762300 RepID=UPI003BB62FC4
MRYGTLQKAACRYLLEMGSRIAVHHQKSITSTDLLIDKVLPFLEEQGMGLIHVFTDREKECCGRPETHDYQLYLALIDIAYTKTKVRHPKTNNICEHTHKTILQEFYQVTFRRRIYRSTDELQHDPETG